MINKSLYRFLRFVRPREFQTVKYSRELERNQWLSQGELQQISWLKLKEMVEHAYQNVPFYQQQFQDIGLSPQDIRTEEDFRCLPFLTKEQIRDNTESLLAENYPKEKMRRDTTSGSTGTPVVLYHSHEHESANMAAFDRSYKWFGGDINDKIAWVWGRRVDIPAPTLKNHIKPERWMDGFNPTVENFQAFAAELQRWKPDIIVGYANVIHLFAQYIQKQNITGIRPKFIQTTAMSIWPHERKRIEEIFQCPVTDRYSSHEAGAIISAGCPQGSQHIFSDVCYVEILKDGHSVAPGEMGEIVITPLYNFGMPLIRYRMEDVATYTDKPCSCKRGLPVLSELMGRTNSILTLPSGRFIHGLAFREPLDGNLAIQQFRIHQLSLDKIEIFLQKAEGFDEKVLKTIETHYAKLLRDEPVDLKVIVTDEMPTTRAGKLLVATSDVPVSFN